MLIDAGADKDQANYIGWTPLHEACFYHRIETVKTLLLAGADPTLRTNQNALPYHLTGLNEIRKMLEEMGGPKAVPEDGDTVDMVKVLTELTMSENEDIDQSELGTFRF
jgi:ankyrin repeat protein